MIKRKKPLFLFLVLLWAMVQAFLFINFGIVQKGEAIKYLSEANYFSQHLHFSEPKYLFYSILIFLHIICIKTGAGIYGVYIVQLLLNCFSMVCFYRLAKRLSNHETTAIVASFLLIICFPWQAWTTHLYTESLFLSLVIILGYQLAVLDMKSRRSFGLFVLTFLLLLFSRPTGMLFIPVLLIYFLYKYRRDNKKLLSVTLALASIAGFILLLNYAMKGEGEFDFLKPFTEEHIICGVPAADSRKPLTVAADGNNIQGILDYGFHHPLHFLQLAIRKIHAFFGLKRAYYSTTHNLYLALFFYPLYIFSFGGAIDLRRKNKEFNVLIIATILLFACSVAFSCDDWLNRFIMPVIPYIILLGALGMMYAFSIIKGRKI